MPAPYQNAHTESFTSRFGARNGPSVEASVPGISIHVIDVTRGEPARAMAVTVFRLDGAARVRVGGGPIGEAGLLDDAALGRGDGIGAGTDEVELAAGDYFRGCGLERRAPAFQETVLFRFSRVDAAEHAHLPVKRSPWGLSIWRGH